MISLTSLQFYINAALETVAVIFMVLLLASYLLRKKENRARLPFCLFTLDLILLLTCNLITWVLDGMFVSPSNRPGLYTLDLMLTVFDYLFYCLAGVLFFNYVTTLIGGPKNGKKKPPICALVIYSFIMTGVFASSMYTGWFYSFPEDGYTYYTAAYWVLVVLSVPAIWLSFFVILKNRALLGRQKTLLLLSYLIVPIVLVIADQLFSLPISYLSLAGIAFFIYIGVDIEQDRELLAQEATIARQEAEKKEMKVNLMMSQIQPHFLYNTLSTIAYLCRRDPKDAEAAVSEFSDYLAGNLRSINAMRPIPFETELGHVENYLKIQARRFQQRIRVEYDIAAKEFRIPALTLQPIVENSVKHGVEKSLSLTTIRIASAETDDAYIVTVKDDGPGFDTAQKPNDDRPHIGLASVRSRLANMVGGTLEIESAIGGGTSVSIVIPKNTEVPQL